MLCKEKDDDTDLQPDQIPVHCELGPQAPDQLDHGPHPPLPGPPDVQAGPKPPGPPDPWPPCPPGPPPFPPQGPFPPQPLGAPGSAVPTRLVNDDQAAELVPQGPPEVNAVGNAPPDVAEKVASAAAVGAVPAFAQIWAIAPYMATWDISLDIEGMVWVAMLTFLIRAVAS